jgi:bifunctional non-homologous end joining protein LigD
VAAYSTRARPGAPVSTPLDWKELITLTSGSLYTLVNVPARLAHLSVDPWAGIIDARPLTRTIGRTQLRSATVAR